MGNMPLLEYVFFAGSLVTGIVIFVIIVARDLQRQFDGRKKKDIRQN